MAKSSKKPFVRRALIHNIFTAGAIYNCTDDKVQFLNITLGKRQMHKIRPVLILGDNNHLHDRTICGIPLSSDIEKEGEYDHVLKKAAYPQLHRDSLVMVETFQPLPKDALESKPIAIINDDDLIEVATKFLNYHGIADLFS